MDTDTFDSPRVTLLPGGKLSRHDAALYLGRKPQTLAYWATIGHGPRVLNIGGRCFYRLDDLKRFAGAEGA